MDEKEKNEIAQDLQRVDAELPRIKYDHRDPDYPGNHESPWSYVDTKCRSKYTMQQAQEYFDKAHPKGKVGRMFETARFYCQRIWRGWRE